MPLKLSMPFQQVYRFSSLAFCISLMDHLWTYGVGRLEQKLGDVLSSQFWSG